MVFIGAIIYEFIVAIYPYFFNGNYFYGYIKPDIWGTIIDSLGIQAGWIFISPVVNYPTWYISVLLLCYIFFYCSTVIAQKKNISPYYLYVILIFLGCAIKEYNIELPFFNSLTYRGLYSFFVGIIIAKYLEKNIPSKKQFICVLLY